jgi:hypothetical protein
MIIVNNMWINCDKKKFHHYWENSLIVDIKIQFWCVQCRNLRIFMNFSLIHWKVPYQFIREKWIEKTNKMMFNIFIDGLSCDVVGIHGI